MPKSETALKELVGWQGGNEQDLYYYVKEFFVRVLGYKKDYVKINETGHSGFPDISLRPKDVKSGDKLYWVVGEVKKERGLFRDPEERKKQWSAPDPHQRQIKKYVSGDTVYALLIDPITFAVYTPDGRELQVVNLDEAKAPDLANDKTQGNIAFLTFDNSVSEVSLGPFKEGISPNRFLDVTEKEARSRFYEALRNSSRELIEYSNARLRELIVNYQQMENEIQKLDEEATDKSDPAYLKARASIERRHRESRHLKQEILPLFEQQIGARQEMPTKPEEAERFLLSVYATEGSSLVLARILFVRFCEDHKLTTRKIGNGGIKAYRSFYEQLKDDYRHLLSDAFKDLESRYRRLFEPSIFDWSHTGNHALSSLLLRIFYRLNAFDFTKVTGDILGNLYERFLDVRVRKKFGEYYTPLPVARYVMERIGFYDDPGPLLDPACGSGTFLIVAVEGLIERLKTRGVSTEQAVKQAVELVHGLDINMFAAFIAQLQLIWHLFPYLSEASINQIPDLKVYGGVNSLVYDPQSTLMASILRESSDSVERANQVRDGQYKYVVGNPPYVRNERLKDWGTWRNFYQEVDRRNSDLAFFFVKRSIDGGEYKTRNGGMAKMPPWLRDKGRMCWVLPVGICDSEAARPLRDRLMQYAMLELVDLEDVAGLVFPSPVASGRGTVVPFLLFSQRARPVDQRITLTLITNESWNDSSLAQDRMKRTSIPQSVFTESNVNPYAQFLLKIQSDDIPLLDKIMLHSKLVDFSKPTDERNRKKTPMLGIKVGGAGRLHSTAGPNMLPLLKGQNIATFHLDEKHLAGWVNLDEVEGKSLWSRQELVSGAGFAVSVIGFAPQAAIFAPKKLTFNDSVALFIPLEEHKDLAWDGILNSTLVRFVFATVLRSGLICHGFEPKYGRFISRAHIYPRTLAAMPVPNLPRDHAERLRDITNSLRQVASTIRSRWEAVEQALNAPEKHTLAIAGVDFTTLLDLETFDGTLAVTRSGDGWRLNFYEEGQQILPYLETSYELLNVVSYLLEPSEESITKEKLESLMVPTDPKPISQLIDNARDMDSPDIRKFKELIGMVDQVIMAGFGLTEEERTYIHKRLSNYPFEILEPRWPWSRVVLREIQEYEDDRFT